MLPQTESQTPIAQTLHRLEQARVVPVIRTETPQDALWLAEQFIIGGLTVLEVTRSVPQAAGVLNTLRQQDSTLCLGVGTLFTPEDTREFEEMSPDFWVSPVLSEPLVAEANALGRLLIPGVMTPSEIYQAQSLGCPVVKLFPVSALGGVSYVRGVASVFPEMRFFPTGGVTLANLPQFSHPQILAVAMGQDLCPSDALKRRDGQFVQEQLRRLRGMQESGFNLKPTRILDPGNP